MSEFNVNKKVRDDEIDLLDLFKRMGTKLNHWGHALGRAFLISIIFLIKRWIPLSLSIAAGIGASVLMKSTSESFYTSDMTLRSSAVPTSEMISYLNKLHTYSSEGNTSALSSALALKSESFGNIIDISAFWVIDQNKDQIPDYVDYKNNHNVYDTTNIRMQDRLAVRVKIKSPQELNLVRNGIITFIESDSLFQQRNRVRMRQNYELLTRLNYDILQLDSLQKIKYFEETKSNQSKNGSQMIFLQEQKTQLVYTDIYELYEKKQILEGERDLFKGIATILSDFSLPAKRDNGTLYYGRVFIPLFFCFTLLILILFSNRKKLKEIYKKY
jgi:hypothetical protein